MTRKASAMRATRRDYEDDWKELAELAHPLRSRLDADGQPNRRPERRSNRNYRDNVARRAVRIAEAGIDAGLASQVRPWFRLMLHDRALMEYQPVKEWIDDATEVIYDFLATGSFYAASKAGWGEMVLFGTDVGIMTEHWRHPHITRQLTVGEYWLENGIDGVPDTLLRREVMTVRELVHEFGLERVTQQTRNAWDSADYFKTVPVCQLIEPNPESRSDRIGAGFLPWRSIWWEERCDDTRKEWWLRRSGFNEKPFWACRWDVVGNDVYGFGPGHDALPEMREMMKLKRDSRLLAENLRTPPLAVPTSWSSQRISLEPQRLNFVPMGETAQAIPLYTPHPQALAAVSEERRSVEEAVRETFYVNLFMAISSMQGVQPRTVEEIVRRHEEQLTQLGPMVARANSEKLSIIVERAFAICARTNLLPPPPRELQGMPLRIEFVSLLTNMQRIAGIREIEAAGTFVLGLAQGNPAVLDKFDFDQAVDEFARIRGVPARVIRPDEEVEAIRQSRAQMEQMQAMAQMAPAAKDAAAAAETVTRMQNGQ